MTTTPTHALHPRHADWARELRSAGLRKTQQRMAILDYLDAHPHSDAEQIYRALADALPRISLQGVHIAVSDLATAGLLRRIDLPESPSARYETRIADNHHHVQCVKCGRIEDVDCVIGEAPCLTPSDTHGMRIVEAHVTFHGICADCDQTKLS